ncbi:MAG: hypothetical protein V9G08_03235 [Dermatophilaceae bacterium]
MPRRSVTDAQLTRARIVRHAVSAASAEGLEGITIGSLATALGMSKAGVVGPFGSKAELQVEVLDRATAEFRSAVVKPALQASAGLPRLLEVVDHWMDYLSDSPFPNGCFITAASCELDGRPGNLRDRLADVVRRWNAFLVEQVEIGQGNGDIDPAWDPAELVQIIVGLAMAANQSVQLLDDRNAPDRARRIMTELATGRRAGASPP